MTTLQTVDITAKFERRLCIEFDDGVRRVDPTEIKFCDEDHADLFALNKYEKERCTNEEK